MTGPGSASGGAPSTVSGGADSTFSATGRKIQDLGREALLKWIERSGEAGDPNLARAALRNPHLDLECLQALLLDKRLHSVYAFRRDVTLHPRTPHAVASRFVATLYWRDLARIGVNLRLSPLLRRLADRLLLQRLDKLALGERISLARTAGAGLLQDLMRQPHPRVIQALLDNPRLTEGAVLPAASGSTTSPQTLEVLASSPRWGNRYGVRLALCRNPRTPLARAVGLVSRLRRIDQQALMKDPSVPAPVRRRARLLVTGQ